MAHAQTTVMAANRQRTSSNAGEEALLVLRQSGFVGTLLAARLDAVSKSLALSDPTDKSPDDVVGRLTLDAETARRLVDAIQTTPPPLSDARRLRALTRAQCFETRLRRGLFPLRVCTARRVRRRIPAPRPALSRPRSRPTTAPCLWRSAAPQTRR